MARITCCLIIVLTGCAGGASHPPATRLVDLFDVATIEQALPQLPVPARTEWRFADVDGPPLAGWQAATGVTDLAQRDGRLYGKTVSDKPLITVERTSGLDEDDMLHAVEVRLRASAGANLLVHFDGAPDLDLAQALGGMGLLPWGRTPIVAGDEIQTYTLTSPFPMMTAGTRHVLVQPTDVAGADFQIESIRLIFRREYLAEFPTGVSWQGLGEIYRETLVARSPERLRFDLDLPPEARLELALGTPSASPVTFRVTAQAGGSERVVLERTVTTADRWEIASIDLAEYAGAPAAVGLELEAEEQGSVGLWGTPVVRSRHGEPARAPTEATSDREPPQGVILVMVDTLRRDHLEAYGYQRQTAPSLTALGESGVRFADCQAQATWTKVSSPSILTGLYPPTHGIAEFADRLPASAVTMAEVFREAGYATLSYSSVLFTGKFTNLHQGFEVLHEATSASDQLAAKTARIYTDRLLPWLDQHRDDPFFVFLHLFDPHDPYEPYAPYDTLWFDPSAREEHEAEMEQVRAEITDPLMKAFLMPTREELAQAGVEADRFISRQIDWYDGSIRGFEVELARLIERLGELGLDEKTLIGLRQRSWRGVPRPRAQLPRPGRVWRAHQRAAVHVVARNAARRRRHRDHGRDHRHPADGPGAQSAAGARECAGPQSGAATADIVGARAAASAPSVLADGGDQQRRW